jgi:hypothetical protein
MTSHRPGYRPVAPLAALHRTEEISLRTCGPRLAPQYPQVESLSIALVLVAAPVGDHFLGQHAPDTHTIDMRFYQGSSRSVGGTDKPFLTRPFIISPREITTFWSTTQHLARTNYQISLCGHDWQQIPQSRCHSKLSSGRGQAGPPRNMVKCLSCDRKHTYHTPHMGSNVTRPIEVNRKNCQPKAVEMLKPAQFEP